MIDFIKLPHWPAFNVADMSITFGVIILALVIELGVAGARREVGVSATRAELLVVDAEDAGLRLDQLLAEPLGSRAQAARLIEAGSRPGRRPHGAASGTSVRPGERIVVAPPRRWRAGAELGGPATGALYASPTRTSTCSSSTSRPGVVVHPARGHRTGTLAQALAGRAAGGEDP